MRFTSSDAAASTGGRVDGPESTFDGAGIDTRTLRPGQLFVPIVAERDGHDFIDGAFSAGATVSLAERGSAVEAAGRSFVRVADTEAGLTDLGRAARARIEGDVIGITGSVGKTSTKDLLAAVLRADGAPTHASDKSFNNELGVPLTLLNAPDDVRSVVVEMGARGIGHIEHLCNVAKPTIGVVTMVAAVHTSEFGDVAAVARAKAELPQAVPESGHVVLNADSPPVAAMASMTDATVTTYGMNAGAAVTATDISLDDDLRAAFRLITPAGDTAVRLAVRGRHQVSNALAAATVGVLVGLPLSSIAHGLGVSSLSPWRMELGRTPTGAVVINDAYNANTMSTMAALDALAAVEADRRVAVLGLMAELGPLHDAEHRAVADHAAHLGIEVIAFAEDAYGVPTVVADIDEAVATLGSLDADTAVLVKGSRVAGLERLAARLTASD